MKTLYFTASVVLTWIMFCLGPNNAARGQEKQASTDRLVFTILYDNRSAADSIIADHGFSCLIESNGRSCLFDAGRNSDKFMANVRTLGVDYSLIDRAFISHIHYDHVGGLFDILLKCNKPILCMPVSYPRPKGEPLGDRADADYNAMLEKLRPFVSEIVQSTELATFAGDFYTTGVIEDQSFEQALIIPTSKGLIVITGCAHPGIVEIVKHAKERMKQDVYFVMGGFHLLSTDSAQVQTIGEELRQLTEYVGPCHCTGEKARAIIKTVFTENYIDVYAGLKLKLDGGELR